MESTPSPPMTAWFGIEETARRLGHLRWWELQLFALLGEWVPAIDDDVAKSVLATASHHHGWRGDLLADRMPTVRDLSPVVQTVAPNEAARRLVEEARAAVDTAAVAALVIAFDVIVPRLVASYEAHLVGCNPAADAEIARTIRVILLDLGEDLVAGAARLGKLLPGASDAATSVRDAFEPLAIAAFGR